MPVYTATFHSHEGNDVRVIHQEFEGTPEEIALDYFRICGDHLGLLETPTGEVVYNDMVEMQAWASLMEEAAG